MVLFACWLELYLYTYTFVFFGRLMENFIDALFMLESLGQHCIVSCHSGYIQIQLFHINLAVCLLKTGLYTFIHKIPNNIPGQILIHLRWKRTHHSLAQVTLSVYILSRSLISTTLQVPCGHGAKTKLITHAQFVSPTSLYILFSRFTLVKTYCVHVLWGEMLIRDSVIIDCVKSGS